MKARRFDFYPDDWIAGTVSLSNADRGLYITVCAMIWSHGGPIEIDELFASCTDHATALKNQLNRLVARGKLSVKGSQIINKRAVNELQKARKRVVNASQNGRKGGLQTSKNNRLAAAGLQRENESSLHLPSPSPSPSPEEEDSEVRTSGADAPADPVKVVWDRGLAILGSGQRALLGKLRKTYGDPVLLAAIVSCESECPSEPVAFLVACCESSKVNGKGSDGHARALETLARAAIEYDERQDRGGFDKAPH